MLINKGQIKTPNDQILLKKLTAFIQNKNAFYLISLVDNLTYDPDPTVFQKLKSSTIQSACSKIIEFLKLGITEKFLSLSDTIKMNDNLQVFFKFIYSSISIWSKLKTSSDAVDEMAADQDTLYILAFLNKLISDETGGSVRLNFKLQTASFLSSLSVKEIKQAAFCKKIVETFCTLLNDSNLIVLNFTLESLNEFLQSSQTNNKILSEIVRSSGIGQKTKEQIGNYLSQIPFDCNKSAKVTNFRLAKS